MNNLNNLINNKSIYNTSQPQSENYYYTKNSNEKKDNYSLNMKKQQNAYLYDNNTNNDEYLSNHVNNINNNSNNDSHINNSTTSFRSRYSSSSIYTPNHSHNSTMYKPYQNTINNYSTREPSISLPSPTSLLSSDKNEYKNVFVKVKTKRMNERFNSFIDYSVYDSSSLKYNREEVNQLKKELANEFNGIDTLDEFKKLNQNEQKKLIIQICRFLMSMPFIYIYIF